MKPVSVAFLFAASAFAAACGAGSAVRPSDPTGADALGDKSPSGAGGGGGASCTTVPSSAEPLVVDWSTNDQVDLTVAMKAGVALVAFDCKSIRLVKNCSAKGAYAFTSVGSAIEEAVKIQNADEAKASLPFSGAKLGAQLQRGASIDIALAYVGKSSLLDGTVGGSELSGPDCAQVTHFVRRATIGAYAMTTGTQGQALAAVDIFGRGGSAASTSTKDRMASAGSEASCKAVKDGDDRPPSGCTAILRLDIQALSDKAPPDDVKAPIASSCPDGFLPGAGGSCVKKGGASSYVCDMTDPQECKDQCKNGNAGSCFNAGTIAQDHDPDPVTMAFYKKACDGGIARGCYLQAKVDSGKDTAMEVKAWQKACDLGYAKACSELGGDVGLTWFPKKNADKVSYYKRACALGQWRDGCDKAAHLLVEGVKDASDPVAPNRDAAVALVGPWCDGGTVDACYALAALYTYGSLQWGGQGDFPKDAAKAASYKTKYCALPGHSTDVCK
jgi:hypothetical protein